MNTPNPRTDSDRYLTYLRQSDETIEELLAGGADLEDLWAAGLLDDAADKFDTFQSEQDTDVNTPSSDRLQEPL